MDKKYWVVLVLGFTFSLLAIYFIPVLDFSFFSNSAIPGLITTGGVAITVILFTTIVLYFGINANLNIPKKLLIFTLLYNILIIWAKFIFGPISFYLASEREVTSQAFSGDNNLGLYAWSGSLVFLLYFIVFYLLFWWEKRRLQRALNQGEQISLHINQSLNNEKFSVKRVTIGVVVGIVILVALSPLRELLLLPLFVPLLFSLPALEYLSFIFSSILGFIIAATLIGALILAREALKSAAKQSELIRDTGFLTTFFTIGVIFLALYHGLWIVYLFVLASIWPLKFIPPGGK